MELTLANTFDEYPNPFYIVRPIIVDGRSDDFKYIYANYAFCTFLGKNRDELIGHSFLENFKQKGERVWLDLFLQVALGKKHTYVNNISVIAGKRMFTEAFYIPPDMCACIIHDYQSVPTDISASHVSEIRPRARYDYLTGFYNRYYLCEKFNEICQYDNIGIAVICINNMKEINDRLGHAAGDARIKEVAKKIRMHFISSAVYRVIGVEFLIISDDTDKREFTDMAETCKKYFDETGSASIGYCYYKTPGNLQLRIDECKELMYEK